MLETEGYYAYLHLPRIPAAAEQAKQLSPQAGSGILGGINYGVRLSPYGSHKGNLPVYRRLQ